MSDELNELLLEMDPEAYPGSKGYLKYVQLCLTQLMEGLSKEKVKDFEETAALWNAEGVDPGLKAR